MNREPTSREAGEAGRDAYRTGLPMEAPAYNREARRAAWRIGWRIEQARAGVTTEQECGSHAGIVAAAAGQVDE